MPSDILRAVKEERWKEISETKERYVKTLIRYEESLEKNISGERKINVVEGKVGVKVKKEDRRNVDLVDVIENKNDIIILLLSYTSLPFVNLSTVALAVVEIIFNWSDTIFFKPSSVSFDRLCTVSVNSFNSLELSAFGFFFLGLHVCLLRSIFFSNDL